MCHKAYQDRMVCMKHGCISRKWPQAVQRHTCEVRQLRKRMGGEYWDEVDGSSGQRYSEVVPLHGKLEEGVKI